MIAVVLALKVCVVPLGANDALLVAPVVRGIEHVYGFSVEVLAGRELPRAAWYAKGKRYRAEKLLDFLDHDVVPDSGCDAVMGWTRVDVSTTKEGGPHRAVPDGGAARARSRPVIEDWGVLGLGRLGGPSAVVSSYRMRAGERTTVVRRAVKTVNHELGHVLGLDHDDSVAGCVMNDAKGTVRSVDRESGLLCDHERRAIEDKWGVTLPRHTRFDWKWVMKGP